MHPRSPTAFIAALAIAALLAACTADDPAVTDGTAPSDDPASEQASSDQPPSPDQPPAPDQPPPTDPNALVRDGSFRGEGVVLPAPEGWSFDPAAYAQGLVLAMDPVGTQQLAAQAVDTDLLPEPVTYQDVLDANRTQFPVEASVDEPATVAGADRAHLLRFDALPGQQDGEPDSSLVVVLADDGDGRLAVFNYVAPSDSFDDALAAELLDGVGFDPDSDPTPPLFGSG